ncbi:5'-nucleotidase C-terminal domain-containing protein [Metabacillus sp. FJAT-52054]|uniref:5'-nucleotidase C-terminal domain-containing protein n=1 Tax=Metabacillus sediminis TaxID=3117746 RepID=A0ABZ2NIN6_9BACI
MRKRKIVQLAAAGTIALSTVAAANPAQGAVITKAEQAVKTAEAKVKALAPFYSSKKLETSPGFLKAYNDAKKSLAAAKSAVQSMPRSSSKTQMLNRIQYSEQTNTKAAHYIDAVKLGKQLSDMQSDYSRYFSMEVTEDSRMSFSKLNELRKAFERKIGKVSGSEVRNAFNGKFTLPAKISIEMTEYEMTQYDIQKKLQSAIDAKNEKEAEALLALLKRVEERGAKQKADLVKLFPGNQFLKESIQIIEKNMKEALQEIKEKFEDALEQIKPKPETPEKPGKAITLSLMHSNDTHANVENAPKRAAAVKEFRNEHPNALLLDAGDVFSGTLYFNEYLGQADLEFMNLMKYDAMTFGNHEFDLGTEPLAKFVEKASFPFVSANVDLSKDANLKGMFHDSVTADAKKGQIYNGIIKEIDGEKVGIFGLTTAETVSISSPGKDVAFENYINEAKTQVAELKKQGVNKIIALTHIGFQDGGGDNDVTLAKEVEGIDIIVGGHSHNKIDAPYVDTTGEEMTVITQANEYSKFLGTLNVTFDAKGKIESHNGKLLDLFAYEDKNVNKKADADEYKYQDDAEALQILNEKYKPSVVEKQKTVVGQTDVQLIGGNPAARTGETNLGDLITDGMLKKAQSVNPDTLIALQNGGGVRTTLDAGDITLSQVLTVLPFGNTLGIMELKGSEIKAALEHSVSIYPTVNGAFLQASGIKYVFNAAQPAGSRVTTIEVKQKDGSFNAIEMDKNYFVATNVFTAKGGDGYTMFAKAYEEGRVSEPGFTDWEIFSDYLKAKPVITAYPDARIIQSVIASEFNGTEAKPQVFPGNVMVEAADLAELKYANISGNLIIKGGTEIAAESVNVAGETIFID